MDTEDTDSAAFGTFIFDENEDVSHKDKITDVKIEVLQSVDTRNTDLARTLAINLTDGSEVVDFAKKHQVETNELDEITYVDLARKLKENTSETAKGISVAKKFEANLPDDIRYVDLARKLEIKQANVTKDIDLDVDKLESPRKGNATKLRVTSRRASQLFLLLRIYKTFLIRKLTCTLLLISFVSASQQKFAIEPQDQVNFCF